jgi:FOG: Ankyrin repeat
VDGDTPSLVAQLDSGLDVNDRTTLLGTHLLTLAAAHGHVDTVQALLERKADVNAADVTGWTPIHAAAYGGKPEIIRLLLDRGAVIPPSNWYTPSPLALAEMLGHTEAVDLLKTVLAPERR